MRLEEILSLKDRLSKLEDPEDYGERVQVLKAVARTHLMDSLPKFQDSANVLSRYLSHYDFLHLMWCYGQVEWTAGHDAGYTEQ